MELNIQAWEVVRHGEFIVGYWPLEVEGRTYQSGDRFPKELSPYTLHALYQLNKIIPVEFTREAVAGDTAQQDALVVRKDKKKK